MLSPFSVGTDYNKRIMWPPEIVADIISSYSENDGLGDHLLTMNSLLLSNRYYSSLWNSSYVQNSLLSQLKRYFALAGVKPPAVDLARADTSETEFQDPLGDSESKIKEPWAFAPGAKRLQFGDSELQMYYKMFSAVHPSYNLLDFIRTHNRDIHSISFPFRLREIPELTKLYTQWFRQKQYDLLRWAGAELPHQLITMNLFRCCCLGVSFHELNKLRLLESFGANGSKNYISLNLGENAPDFHMIDTLITCIHALIQNRNELISCWIMKEETETLFANELYLSERYDVIDHLLTSYLHPLIHSLNVYVFTSLVIKCTRNAFSSRRGFGQPERHTLLFYLIDRGLIRPFYRINWDLMTSYYDGAKELLEGLDTLMKFLLNGPIEPLPFSLRMSNVERVKSYLNYIYSLIRWYKEEHRDAGAEAQKLRLQILTEWHRFLEEENLKEINRGTAPYTSCINLLDEILSHEPRS
jgi:hypothetical protein